MAGNIKGLHIEISGSTTKLTEALKAPQKETANLKSKLSAINTALKFDTKNVDLLDQKQRILTKTIGSTEEELRILKEAQAQYIASGKDIDGAEYVALEKKIALVEKSLENLKKQQNNFNGELQAMGIKLGEFGNSAVKTGTALTKSVTAPLTAVGVAAAKTTADFDSAMSEVLAISSASETEFVALRDKAREMGAATKFSATESAEALKYMAMAGWEPSEMMDGLSGVMNLAAASGEDLAKTSDIVTDALTAFGLEAKDAGNFADILAQASRKSNTNVSLLGESFKYCAPVAGALGASAEDTAIALGLMANAGIKGSQAGNSLKNALVNLYKPTAEQKTVMEELGITMTDDFGNAKSLGETMDTLRSKLGKVNVALTNADGSARSYDEIMADLSTTTEGLAQAQQIEAAATLFGKQNLSGMLAVVNASDEDYQKLTESIYNCNGVAEEMANTMNDNLQGQLTLLKSALEELFISIGDTMMPVIRKAVALVQEWVDRFNSMSDETKQVIVVIGALAASIGPALIVIGKMSLGVSSLISYFGSTVTMGGKVVAAIKDLAGASTIGVGAFAAIVAAIAACVAAFVHLWNTNEEFRSKMIEIWNAVKEAFQKFVSGIQERFEALGITGETFTKAFSDLWNGFCNLLAPVFTLAWQTIADTLKFVLDALMGVLDVFIGIFTGDWDTFTKGIGEIFTAGWENVKNTFKAAVNFLKDLAKAFLKTFDSDWQTHWNSIKTFFQNTWNSIKTFFQNCLNGISSFFTSTWNNLSNFATSTWTFISNKASQVWNGIKNYIVNPINSAYTTVRNVFQGIYDYVSSRMSAAADAIGNAVSRIREFFNFKFQWPHIPLPHFTVSGSLNPIDWIKGGLPSIGVEWYRKAMDGLIFNSPTFFGMNSMGQLMGAGEAGAEALVGVRSLREMVYDAVASASVAQIQKSQVMAEPAPVVEIDYDRIGSVIADNLKHMKIEGNAYLDKTKAGTVLADVIDRRLQKTANRR